MGGERQGHLFEIKWLGYSRENGELRQNHGQKIQTLDLSSDKAHLRLTEEGSTSVPEPKSGCGYAKPTEACNICQRVYGCGGAWPAGARSLQSRGHGR